jgi:hypothetical protein
VFHQESLPVPRRPQHDRMAAAPSEAKSGP